MAPHTPGVLRFGKLSKKPVATAGYKNKQTVSRRRYLARVLSSLMYRYALRQSASVSRFLYPAKGYGDLKRDSLINSQLFAILQQIQRLCDNGVSVAFFQLRTVTEAPEDTYGEGACRLAGLHICGSVSHVEHFVCGETKLV